LQQHFEEQQEKQSEELVESLKVGEKPMVAMMQQLFRRYLDVKGSLFSALKNYQASFFYWALMESKVHPQIIDKVGEINKDLNVLTKIDLDKKGALENFSNKKPQTMPTRFFHVTSEDIIKNLQVKGEATWTLPLNANQFVGNDRVRLTTVRVWLEGAKPEKEGQMISIDISTSGNYRDRLNGKEYLFTSKPLSRGFQYEIISDTQGHYFQFDDKTHGRILTDGKVDDIVSFAYFKPTPFTEWTIKIDEKKNTGLDLTKLTKITMEFAGSTVYN